MPPKKSKTVKPKPRAKSPKAKPRAKSPKPRAKSPRAKSPKAKPKAKSPKAKPKAKPTPEPIPDTVEEIEEVELDENDLELDDATQSFIYEYNPLVHKVNIYYNPEDRRMSEVMTKFEYTEAVSIRARQIENGGSCFTDVAGLTDPILMAEKEIADKKCPLDLLRHATDRHIERWHVNEMTIPQM